MSTISESVAELLSSDVAHVLEGALSAYVDEEELPLPTRYALQLWLAGVRPRDPGSLASWLHLSATAQGDAQCVAAIEESGVERPWTVVWHHWRPPGTVIANGSVPSPVDGVFLAPEDWDAHGQTAVIGLEITHGGKRYTVWDLATGELLAGPWTGSVPSAGQREPLWLNAHSTLLDWVNLDTLRDDPLVTGEVSASGITVIGSLGGIFAIRSSSTGSEDLVSSCVESDVGDEVTQFPFTVISRLEERPGVAGGILPPFEDSSFQRVPFERILSGMGDHKTRQALEDTGIPEFSDKSLTLGRPSSGWSPTGRHGNVLPFGSLVQGVLVFDMASGDVFRIPRDARLDDVVLPAPPASRDDFQEYNRQLLDFMRGGEERIGWIAPDFATFLALAARYLTFRAQFRMTNTSEELHSVRDVLDVALGRILPSAMESWWTADLREVV
ncbi:hypothetical protein AB0467_17335 [Streptomyces sp. NPDC052095]|uniref:hypothetical protein n=1 Tax=unclassified Streptomyces TaxID=2593676 RepID=UPI00344D52BB